MTEGRARVLVVDDEPAILRTLRTNLHGHGFDVETAENVRDALAEYDRARPDVVLLDLGLPDDDGLVLIRDIRGRAPTPIIVVSARDDDRDKVNALDLGADDYLTKPFSVDELLARIRVALRHVARPPVGTDAVFEAGDLRVDLGRREVKVGDRGVRLTPTEYDVLKALIANPDRVLTFSMLLRRVWGPGYTTEGHYLHVYIARLRKKLEADPQAPRWIVSEPGVGYRLRTDGPRPGSTP
ncbi:MAG: two-component system, OmpR family, operon response regulator KdpE [Chloroflexota bacterium]|nr:two-component system, OmpR family, operon response regulator KdpE [Chloroflexota bacterium]